MTVSFSRRALVLVGAVPVSVAVALAGGGLASGVESSVVPVEHVAASTWSVLGSGVPKTAASADTGSVELGMRFSSSKAASVVGVRFFKGSPNTGTHTGTLWSSTGARLATATFTAESASGWQSVRFTQPVAVTANTAYVVSYHTNGGRYAADLGGFNSPIVSGPLTGTGSVYRYGTTGYPTSSYKAANYWVDAIVTDPAATTTTTKTPTTTTTPTTAAPTTTTKPVTTTTRPVTTTTAPAPVTGFPDAASTGVPTGTALTARGSFTVTAANTVIDALAVTGQITVAAPNVTIKRSRFTGTGHLFGVQIKSGGSVRVEDSEFSGNYTSAAIGHDNWTMVRSEITALPADGVKLGNNVLMQDNWLHDFATATGAHADGAQVQNGVTNVTVRHNSIMLTSRQNAALFIRPSLGPSSDGPILLENNRLSGGNYTIFVVNGGDNEQWIIKNITVRNNRFTRDNKYGTTHFNMPVTTSGNVWDDNGTPLPI